MTKLLSLVAFLVFMPAAAMAGWYVGADGVYAGVLYTDGVASVAPSALYGANAYVGYNLAPSVGVEVGYLGLWGSNSSIKAQIQGGTADGILRIPLAPLLNNTSLDLTGGVTYLNGSLQSGSFTAGAYNWGLRAGGGIEYALSDNIHWRLLVRYQQDSFHATQNGAIVVSSGITFSFE